MLDTNIVSDLIRDPYGAVAKRLGILRVENCCVSIFTASELRYGALKKGSPRLSRDVEQSLLRIAVIPFEVPADTIYAEIRDALTRSGQLIGPVDLFIAAHALALDLTLVTANTAEFSRVPGLRVENWRD
jgi:tRNA(fMet)-specific endonuclease VapC